MSYLNIQDKNGRIYGFKTTVGSDRFNLFIEKNLRNEELDDESKKNIQKYIGVDCIYIDNISVQNKGQGHGTKMLKEFLMLGDVFFLVADVKQSNNFDLVDWYKRHNFQIIGNTFYGPIMLFSKEI